MAPLRTHLTILDSSAAQHGSLPLLKIPCDATPSKSWKSVTCAEFQHDVETCAKLWAHTFSEERWTKGSVVGVWLKGTSYQDIVTIWAISRAGYVPQLISIRMPNPVVVYELLKCAGAMALIADQNFESLLADSPFPVLYSVNVSSDGCEGLPALEPLATPSDPKNIVMIFHTSGSTSGSPKLVPITTKWLDSAIEKMGQFQMPSSMVKQQTVVSGGSFCHMASNLLLWGYIHRGGCIILPTMLPYASSEIQQMVSHCGLTTLNMFSSFLSKVFVEARQSESLLTVLKSLNQVFYSGLPLNAEDEHWARGEGLRLVNVFACTEVGVMLQSDERFRTALRPVPGCVYEFVPVSDSPTSEERLLELVVCPESPDCPHPSLLSAETGKFHTGDLFIEAQPGLYFPKGRNDDWIKMENAMRCNALEIEEDAMQTCGNDLIDAAVVVGSGRACPVLIVEPKEDSGAPISGESSISLRKEILRRIMPFHTRRYVHERIDDVSLVLVAPRASLPRTVTKGNIRRSLVEEKYRLEMDAVSMSRA